MARAEEAPQELWDALTSDDETIAMHAEDDLVRFYQSFLEQIARGPIRQRMPHYIWDDDLLSYGQVGLLKAIRRYDPVVGSFRKYASTIIYGAILDELRSQDWAPRALRRDQRVIAQAQSALTTAGDLPPSLSLVAEHLGWEAARLESTMQRITNANHVPMDTNTHWEGSWLETRWYEETTQQAVNAGDILNRFVDLFDSFDEMTQYVVARIYFLHDTLGRVAEETGLPVAQVRVMHNQAVSATLDTMQDSVRV